MKERERDRKRERRTKITHRVREADSKRFKRYCLEMVGLNHGEDPYPRVCWGGACVTLGDRSRSPTRGKRRFAIISGTSTAVVIKVIRSAFTFFLFIKLGAPRLALCRLYLRNRQFTSNAPMHGRRWRLTRNSILFCCRHVIQIFP